MKKPQDKFIYAFFSNVKSKMEDLIKFINCAINVPINFLYEYVYVFLNLMIYLCTEKISKEMTKAAK